MERKCKLLKCVEIYHTKQSLKVKDCYFLHIYRHTASIAAGNHGVPVIVSNYNFGNASGIAPRAQ